MGGRDDHYRRRIQTVRQLFNVWEGLLARVFDFSGRLKKPLTKGSSAGIVVDFDALRRHYFAAMGWDAGNGKPSEQNNHSG